MSTKTKKPEWTLWKSEDGRYFSSNQKFCWNPQLQRNEVQTLVEIPASECQFVAAMKLKSFYHGRSAHFYFQDLQTGHQYLMQGTEMEDILMNYTLHQGLICGKWGWVKRGSTISIKLLEELEDVSERIGT